MTTYLLDSDVFIQAKNWHYGFDIVPAFWQWIEQAHVAGVVYTVERCAEEVIAGADELAEWMENRPDSFRLQPRAEDVASMQATSAWAVSVPNYSQGAVAGFAGIGDFYLVAQAHSLGYTVVTHEGSHPDSKNRIMIPDACAGLGIPWMSPFQMLRSEGVRFSSFTSS